MKSFKDYYKEECNKYKTKSKKKAIKKKAPKKKKSYSEDTIPQNIELFGTVNEINGKKIKLQSIIRGVKKTFDIEFDENINKDFKNKIIKFIVEKDKGKLLGEVQEPEEDEERNITQ